MKHILRILEIRKSTVLRLSSDEGVVTIRLGNVTCRIGDPGGLRDNVGQKMLRELVKIIFLKITTDNMT